MYKTTATVAAVLAAFLFSNTARAKDLRIGVVDMQRAVSETDDGRAAEAQLMGVKKKLEAELNRKMKEFYEDDEKLKKAWSILKDDERRKRSAESRKKFEELQKRYVDAERDLMEKKTKAMLKITKKLNGVIQKIAQNDKFDYIFNGAAVLWAPRHTDITNEVIRNYNKGAK
jgi:outer membrane protein